MSGEVWNEFTSVLEFFEILAATQGPILLEETMI